MPIGRSEAHLNTVYLSLGSNLGDRLDYLRSAFRLIEDGIGLIEKKSSVYETEAWGKTDQGDFLNVVILVITKLQPEELLKRIHQIENELGRERSEHWGPRTIDIDILLFNRQIIREKKLEVPHPRMLDRNFVMRPLAEIAPEYIMPETGESIKDLSTRLEDSSKISIFIP